MQRLNTSRQHRGWAMLDALLALGLWSMTGIALMLQARATLSAHRLVWRQAQAIEWQSDLFERLRLAPGVPPVAIGWEQNLSASPCVSTACDLTQWRDSLIADWQMRLYRDMPGAQTLLAPWMADSRIWVVAIRWPQTGQASRTLPVNNLPCPANWYCSVALGWP